MSRFRPPVRIAPWRVVPRVETLEAKLVLSTLTVTSPLDDGSPGTLRSVIATSQPGDTIDFDPSLNRMTIAVRQGRLEVPWDLTITAADLSSGVYIDGLSTSGVFLVDAGVHATLDSLTIERGRAVSDHNGGGILNRGTLDVRSCLIQINTAVAVPNTDGGGGGIFNDQGTVTIENSRLDINSLDSDTFGDGSAIDNYQGTVVITDSDIAENLTGSAVVTYFGNTEFVRTRIFFNRGSGIENVEGTLAVDQSEILGNQGAGIYSLHFKTDGPSTVTDSDVSGNAVGIFNQGVMTVTNATVDGNFGRGIVNFGESDFQIVSLLNLSQSTIRGNIGGGIMSYDASQMTITDSTIADNTASSGAGILAGFPESRASSSIVLERSTISGNRAIGQDAAGGGILAGAFGGFDSLTVDNSTISGNSCDGDGGGIESSGFRLAITSSTIAFNAAGPTGRGGGLIGQVQSLRNSIIADNTAAIGVDVMGTITSQGYNLIQDPTGATITGDETGNLYGVDPLLAPLADNGGFTPTHALMEGSPAIGAGDPSSAGTTDQRGVVRPVAVDMGAYQTDGAGPAPIARPAFTFAVLNDYFNHHRDPVDGVSYPLESCA